MAPFDRPYDFPLVGYCKYSSTVFKLFGVESNNIVTLKSGLEVTQGVKVFETGAIPKLWYTVSYSPWPMLAVHA